MSNSDTIVTHVILRISRNFHQTYTEKLRVDGCADFV